MRGSMLIGGLAAAVGVGSATYMLLDEEPAEGEAAAKTEKGRAKRPAGAQREDRSDWETDDRIAALEDEVAELRMQVRALKMRRGAVASGGDGDLDELALGDPVFQDSVREIVADERERRREQEMERRRERFEARADEVLDELSTQADLAPAQREKIGGLWTEERDQMFALMMEARRGERDFREVRQQARELRRVTDEQVEQLLSEDQYAVYDELRPRGPGRGGRGPRGGRPGGGAPRGE